MIAKTFEIRDEGTFIPCLAVKLTPTNDADRYLLSRSGFGRTAEQQSTYVMVWPTYSGNAKATTDICDQPNHTMQVAHQYIEAKFDDLESGSVIDVEHVTGKRSEPKVSERVEFPS